MPDDPREPSCAKPDPKRGKLMQGRKCKHICRSCGTMIDCSDAY